VARRPRPASRDRAGIPARGAAAPRRRSPLAFVIFLAAVFAVKLVAVLQLEDHVLLQPDAGLDTTIYVTTAQRVLGGDLSLGPGLYFISPLYIYFLAAVLAVSQSFTAVRIVQIALGTAAVALIFATARIWFGTRAAWIAAGLAALTGLFTFYEVLLLQAALDPVLTAAALACVAVALRHGSQRWFVLAGLAFGIQALNRPNVLIAAAGVALTLALTRPQEKVPGTFPEKVPGTFSWGAALVLAAGVLIGLAPVTIRNLAVAGDWSPVSSHGGLNFYIGNNAEADGTYHSVPGITPSIEGQQHDAKRIAEQKIGRPLSDADVSAYFYGQGTDWIRTHPRDAARLFARKIAYTFNSAHLWLNFSLPFYAYDMNTVLRWSFVGPWLLIPLGLFGLALPFLVPGTFSEKVPGTFLVWVAFVPFYALAVAMFFAAERYRLPLLVPFCAGAGAAIDWLIAAASARNLRRLTIGAAALVPLFIAANWRFGLDNGLAEERTRMAERLISLDRIDEATAWATRAEPLYAQPAVLHLRIGRRLLLAKQPARALPYLRKAEQQQPGQAEIGYALGQALLDTKHAKDAIPFLRRAYEAGVRTDLAGYDLVRAHAAVGNRPAALAVLQNVRPADPKDAASWHSLGQLALDLDAPRLAEPFFRQAVAAKPDSATSHGQLGIALAFTGRYDESIRALQEAVRLDPKSPAARLNLAVSLAEVGRTNEARALATEALSLDPNYERARQFLGAIAGK
jgi:tetratricopeptide (TPR) repeat protein